MVKMGMACAVVSLGLIAAALPADEKKSDFARIQQEWLQAATKRLALTDQQQQEIHQLQADCLKKAGPVMKQLETLKHEEHEAMSNVLTADQRKKLPDTLCAAWEKECQSMAGKLGLNDAQKQRIDKIHEEYRPKFRELVTQKTDNSQQRIEELKHALVARIWNELTDEQRVRFPFVLHEEMRRVHEPAVREQMKKEISSGLGLTADQKAKIDQIEQQYQPKLEKQVAQLKQLHQDEKVLLEKVLNADQRTKLQEIRKGNAR